MKDMRSDGKLSSYGCIMYCDLYVLHTHVYICAHTYRDLFLILSVPYCLEIGTLTLLLE